MRPRHWAMPSWPQLVLGIYSEPTEPIADLITISETYEPDAAAHQMYEDFFGIWRRVYFNLLEEMRDHHELLYKYDFE